MKKNNFEIQKVAKIFQAEFKMRFKSLIIWSGAMLAILFLYMLLFPSIKDMAMDKIESMPPELLAMFGMSTDSDFTNYNLYFSAIYQIILLVLCANAINTASSCLHDEESSGTIEFLNSCKVSRLEIYLGKVFVVVTNLVIIVIFSFLGILISGAIVAKGTMDVPAIFYAILISYVAIITFAGIGFLVSTLAKKSLKASKFGLAIFFGTYVIGYLSNIGPEFLSFLKWLSPLDFLSPNIVMNSTIGIGTNNFNIFSVILGLMITIGTSIGGYFVYRKKDL